MIVFLGNFILHLVHYFNEKNCQYGIFTKKYFVEIYTNCINNLKQLNNALVFYGNDYDGYQ